MQPNKALKKGQKLATELYNKTPQKVKTAALYSTGVCTLLIFVPIAILIIAVSVLTSFLWLPPLVIGLYIANLLLSKFYP